MKVQRPYVQRARAQSAEETRRRILEAAGGELWHQPVDQVRLEDVAARAQVTVQTVLRIFGSRSELLRLALEPLRDRILAQREVAVPGDIEGTVAALFDHYEHMGDFVIHNLSSEQRLPELLAWLDRGRADHRASLRRQFAPQLARRKDREAALDCLVVACDVYTWKLLRRDAGRSRREAETRVRYLVERILEEG
ncbi:MAG: TetR/AcrR family transcriptional regulator [Candidatus Dormibacteria bacterium]